ncbi:diaminohydroxyphosphoribosylaminopyrimidine deaminase [Chromobacterium violaceum]|uniref:bifunctional diaminohydroxyphosphoribosylaminopyrimidine deaminase/5-amino-6-(5-phosphoribosylamino)uracil reductase RibD n=1 Tax=Chromobacterium violaceum TaxID=536 RepID=UPI000652FC4B|nr:bifunctional diaminohydroxyphosphoribosylaminopyrimidine deaminase/5-amino-6-(5-phosphoribosylamino)uracil reductase RibD [Chromobacterium violaceum]KMN48456.1 diaminohydroxyphosphoribosylaminopyrimidine deaminase [Chromobacterium violaceum]KMN85642.1 diaminohydroxyphosphoribosylaminopyrimidine deaminase [Chromobacterium violaceum]KMN91547.1 diaminohydroxyphosphoribosylaminopyrimidine deaminase [Chromobacterium violaceum]KMO05731.1 diaminohydroxyphosphoribosylaminopyrimidine deaminase [Chrom
MTDYSADDYLYMQRALRLAEGATRRAAPNPGVGCVLVNDGRVVGEGATLALGSDHAEVQAIKDCLARGESPRGATAYVTLEPCSHHGRTPPCAERLVKEGVARVVAAMVDPYHEVSGRGIAMLRAAGVEASAGLMEAQARRAHRGFLSRVERGRPWVTLKAAATLDGKTALLNGRSKWITGPEARMDVQRLRAAHCAILTGSGTVLADDPQLTVRELQVASQPWRVVLDGDLRTDPAARVYQGGGAWLASCAADAGRLAAFRGRGVEVLTLARLGGKADLADLLAQLARRGVNELMVEAGAGLNGAMLRAGLVDEIVLYLASSLAGDAARGLFAWPALDDLADKVELDVADVGMVGRDLRLTLRPRGA